MYVLLSIFGHRLGLGLNTVDGYIAECVDYIWYSHRNIKLLLMSFLFS